MNNKNRNFQITHSCQLIKETIIGHNQQYFKNLFQENNQLNVILRKFRTFQ